MHVQMKKLRNLRWPVPSYAHLPLILCFATMMCAYYFPRLIDVQPRFDFVLPIDEKIPLIPLFSYIYIPAYAYWALSYIYVSRFSKELTDRLFVSDLIGQIVSLTCFLILPSELARPSVEEVSGIGAWLTKIVYMMDEPNNLLPSLHCFVSYISFRPLVAKGAPKSKPVVLISSFVYSALVCLSTLFTRQHVILDLITGLALGEIAWQLSGCILKRIKKEK